MNMVATYTLADLEEAKENLLRSQERAANARGNNPNKGRADIRFCVSRVRAIEADLKSQGLIDRTEDEVTNVELDKLHPNAKSKSTVTHKGQKFQIKYFPTSHSRSGITVLGWGHKWHPV